MKVSVIIPVYNGEEYIQDCIYRLCREQYPELEIIVINDGSSDKTADILDALCAKNSAVKVITQKNGGVSSARNAGLDASSGDAVMFLDCDDATEQNCIHRLVDEMQKTDADIVRFRLCYSYPDGTVSDGRAEYAEKTVIYKKDFFDSVYLPMLRGVRYNHIVRTLYRKSVIDGLRFRTDLKTAEDLCFNIQAFGRAQSYVYLPDLRYFYYCSGTGLTGSGLSWREKLLCNIKAARALKDALPDWGYDTFLNRLRADFRLARITAAKIKRIFTHSDAF